MTTTLGEKLRDKAADILAALLEMGLDSSRYGPCPLREPHPEFAEKWNQYLMALTRINEHRDALVGARNGNIEAAVLVQLDADLRRFAFGLGTLTAILAAHGRALEGGRMGRSYVRVEQLSTEIYRAHCGCAV